MALKVWNVGDVLAAADLNTWTLPQIAISNSDQSVTNSIVMVSDSQLLLPVVMNATYSVEMYLVADGPASNGLVAQLNTPAGSSGSVWCSADATTPQIAYNAPSAAFAIATTGAGNNFAASVRGILITAGNAGTLQFQFAQSIANATAVRRRSGSYLMLRRIG